MLELDNVVTENPDLADRAIRAARRLTERLAERLAVLPLCPSHLDYGVYNIAGSMVIDWQHHALAPIGFDVHTMLAVASISVRPDRYAFTQAQRDRYRQVLTASATTDAWKRAHDHHADFVVARAFFYLAHTRPTTTEDRFRLAAWRYRRDLFQSCLDQYETSRSIDMSALPMFQAPTNPDQRRPDTRRPRAPPAWVRIFLA